MKRKGIIVILLLVLVACSDDFLELSPQGELSQDALLTTEEGVEGVLLGAYSVLNGQVGNETDSYNSPGSNWTFGDIVSDDAYKGSSGVSDQEGMHLMEIFQVNSTVKDVSKKWNTLYEGISRCNLAMRLINQFEGWSQEQKNIRLGEARFLRGHYYFDLKKIYNRFPYVDEQERTPEELKQISNTEFTSDQLWQKIEEDFEFAANSLPNSHPEIGRATSSAAYAYLAKAYAYQQKWSEVITASNNVTGHALLENYGDLWLPEFNNNIESVFSIQHSVGDGSGINGVNGNMGDRLNNLGGPYPRVYGFHTPSENLVRSYKTTSSGLPSTSTVTPITPVDFIDPRLDFTVGRNGIPFYDAGDYSEAWTRGVAVYGPYATKKGLVPLGSGAMLEVFPWTNYQNFILIRYADVLLIKAEALVETGDLEQARSIVNQIRNRAKNSYEIMSSDGSGPAPNYRIEPYNNTWSNQDQARQAVRLERRLELAMEGHRFFDLVRWGIAAQRMNEYITSEQVLRGYLSGAAFSAGTNEYFPLPQDQIDLSGGNLTQNPGY